MPFTKAMPDSPRLNWHLMGFLISFCGLFFVVLLLQNDKFAGAPAVVGIALVLIGAGSLVRARRMPFPTPVVDPIADAERRGVFFAPDALLVWNGETACYIPREEVRRAYRSSRGRGRGYDDYYVFSRANSKRPEQWRFPEYVEGDRAQILTWANSTNSPRQSN